MSSQALKGKMFNLLHYPKALRTLAFTSSYYTHTLTLVLTAWIPPIVELFFFGSPFTFTSFCLPQSCTIKAPPFKNSIV